MLLFDIVSLNLFTFIGYPFASLIFDGNAPDNEKDFLEKRKAENVELVLRRIKKD